MGDFHNLDLMPQEDRTPQVYQEFLMQLSWVQLLCTMWTSVMDLVKTYQRKLKWWAYGLVGVIMPTPSMLDEQLETCDWQTATIRYIALNSTGLEQAVLTCNDTVLLYNDLEKAPRLLSCNRQRHISCAAFRPWTAMDLAVGCHGGICIWHQMPSPEEPRTGHKPHIRYIWLPHVEDDFVVDLQWLQMGSYLASATIGERRVQIWQPETGQLMQQLEMPCLGTYCWLLRHDSDMLQLLHFLESAMPPFQYSELLDFWCDKLTDSQPVQSAVWTSCGNHLLFALRGSSKVSAAICTWSEDSDTNQPQKWTITEIIELKRFCCQCEYYEGGPIQAMAIDPCGIYVGCLFKQKPFVLLCLLHIPLENQLCLRLVRLIECHDSPTAFPTCVKFGYVDQYCGRDPVLAIGWSNGQLLMEELVDQYNDQDALPFEEDELHQHWINVDI